MRAVRPLLTLALGASVLVAACGGSSAAEGTAPTIASSAIPTATRAASSPLLDWP